jgi:hypothetical protein
MLFLVIIFRSLEVLGLESTELVYDGTVLEFSWVNEWYCFWHLH